MIYIILIEYQKRTLGPPVQLNPGIVTLPLPNNISNHDRIIKENSRVTLQLDPGIVTLPLSNNIPNHDRIIKENSRVTNPAGSRYNYTPSF